MYLSTMGFGCGWICVLLGVPACFVLLPISRKKAKVRWRHIGRVTTYSLFIPAAAIAASGLCISLAYAIDSWRDEMLTTMYVLAGVQPVLLIVWWASATKRYLRMPHGLAVAILLTVLATLLSYISMGLVMKYGVTG